MARESQHAPIVVRLIHDGAQPGPPLAEALAFGAQDAKGAVHAGVPIAGGRLRFDLALEVLPGTDGAPVFRGSFVHGPPSGRFLYLSWKREGEHAHPWGWRIKMKLSGIDWALIRAAQQPGFCLAADVVGRRPHAGQAIEWRVEQA